MKWNYLNERNSYIAAVHCTYCTLHMHINYYEYLKKYCFVLLITDKTLVDAGECDRNYTRVKMVV